MASARRGAERRWIEDALRPLHPGATTTIPSPDGQPIRRVRYQRINAVAYKLWGKGGYTIRQRGITVEVCRAAAHG